MNDDYFLDYFKVNIAEKCKVLPKQKSFTFILKSGELPEVYKMDENKEASRLGDFQDRVMDIYHDPSGEFSVIGMDYQGNEKQQLYLIDHKMNIEPLVKAPEHFHYFGGWSPNGKYISFSSNRRHPGYFDIFIINIETKKVKKIYEYNGRCTPIKWLPDGENIVISIPVTNIDNALYILNIDTGRLRRIGDHHKKARYQSIEFMKDKNIGYVLTDLNSETLYLSQFSIESPHKIEKLVEHEGRDIEEISLSPNEQNILYTLNDGGISRLFHYKIEEGSYEEIKVKHKGVINSLSWSDDNNCIFSLKTPKIPGDIWNVQLNNHTVKRQTHYSVSKRIENLLVKPRIYTYKSFDGLEVPYFYYSKFTDKNVPAIVWVHGGPESQTRATYNPIIQYFVYQGFAVVAPNVRGSRGYGRTYLQLDDGRKRMDSVKDLVYLYKSLVNHHNIDANRVGIMGRSYGGFMVLASLTHYPELWAAGINIVGISHFKTFLENTGPWRRYLREFEYGSLKNEGDFFEKIAPLNYSHKIKAPLLVFHGKNDTRVPVSEAKQLVKDMKERNQKVELIVFPDEGHQTVRLKNQLLMNKKSVEFMKQHLLI